MIILKNVSFDYESSPVLKNCSITFPSNEVHLILGPTGVGKTTLALILARLLKPKSGRVIFPRGNIENLCREIGFLFQFPEDLFFNDTVYEELAYGAKKHNLKEIDERVSRVLKLVGLEKEILSGSPFDLSFGEKRLVALASILICDPSWLILDEPFCDLDWQLREKIAKTIEKLKGKVGIIIITHNLDDIIEYVDRVSLLVDGRVAFTSLPEEVEWDEVMKVGCDIPRAVLIAKKLRENGIDVSLEWSIPRLVKALKE